MNYYTHPTVIYTEVLRLCTRYFTFTVGIVLPKGSEAISAATDSSVLQVPADRMLHAVMSFSAKVMACTETSMIEG